MRKYLNMDNAVKVAAIIGVLALVINYFVKKGNQ